MAKKPATIKKTWTLQPDQGSMFLVGSAPAGYVVESIDRKGTKAVVTYKRK